MKEDLYDDLYLEEKEEKTDFKAVLFKYTIHWPWFVACILLCMAGAWLYCVTPRRYTTSRRPSSSKTMTKQQSKQRHGRLGRLGILFFHQQF